MWNEKTHTQNDAAFVAFYNMRAVTFVLPDEMFGRCVDLQWFILTPRRHGHSRSHNSCSFGLKIGKNVCLSKISDQLEFGSPGVINYM